MVGSPARQHARATDFHMVAEREAFAYFKLEPRIERDPPAFDRFALRRRNA
jgi:hypothetical protein